LVKYFIHSTTRYEFLFFGIIFAKQNTNPTLLKLTPTLSQYATYLSLTVVEAFLATLITMIVGKRPHHSPATHYTTLSFEYSDKGIFGIINLWWGARNKCGSAGSITSILFEMFKNKFCENIEKDFMKIKEKVTYFLF